MKKFRYALVAFAITLLVIIPAARSFYAWIMEKPVLFDAQGAAVVSVEKPGEITVWYYTETVSGGRYTKVEDIPDGVKITATYKGRSLPVRIDKTTTINGSGGERRSIFSIPADQAGEYVIGLGNAKGIKFAVTTGSGIKGFFLGFFLCSMGVFLCLTTGVLVVLAAVNVFPKNQAPESAA